jgi:predicted dehydrogenase
MNSNIVTGDQTRAKHLPALSTLDNVLITAVADTSAERLERVAGEFRVPHRFENVHELLASADVDAVGICVPPEAHPDTAIVALNAGKHVWIDKPLALNPSECLRIIQAADKTHPIAMTGFHMRFHRLVRRARELLLSGALGSLETVQVIWHSPRGDANIPEWKRKRSLGGGSLIEIAVHHFDLLRYLLKSELTDIVAYTRDGTRDDECAAILARMANGVLVTGEFSERAPHAIEITVNGHDALLRLDCLRFDGLELRGRQDVPGAPAVRLKSMQRFLASLPEGIGVMRRGGDYRDSYRLAWSHFVESIRSQREPEATLDDGLRATEAVCRALEAHESGGCFVSQER